MEYFDVCDEYGVPTGETVSREMAHNKGIRHRTSHVWIVRKKDGRYQVLLQRRSRDKDSFPGMLDTSSAGHIPAGAEPLDSAIRELHEELGIKAEPEDLVYAGQFHDQYELEFHGKPFRDDEVTNIYVYRKPVHLADLVLQKEEIESVGWYDLEETIQKCTEPRDPEYCVPTGGLKILSQFLSERTEQGQEDSEPRRLIILNNRIEAEHIAEILKESGIPTFIKEYGLGSLYGSYLGMFGESGLHIYVPDQVYAAAKKILEEMGIHTD
ncbi:MAG: NUDIX domain-containing protein [Blautia sp.]|nr:NUDIX domain-containing protein [Blautia sp.]